MSRFASVLELAQEVTRRANRITDNAASDADAKRVLQQTDSTKVELGKLEKAVKCACILLSQDSEALVNLSGLDSGREAFARNAADRRNAYPAGLQHCPGEDPEVASRVNERTRGGLVGLDQPADGTVPTLRISLLPVPRQAETWERWTTLQKLSRVVTPEPSDITSAVNALSYLDDELKDIDDPPNEVAALVERLGRRPFLTLADVTDEQIEALRAAKVADQLEVRRRGA